MSLRTPLGRVQGLGSAKEGVEHWWLQRLTSVALVPLGIWFVVSLATQPSLEHAAVVKWLGQSWTALLMLLFMLSVTWHSQLGVRVVIEDYVHGGGKTAWLIASTFAHIVVAVIGVFAILKIAFGAAA